MNNIRKEINELNEKLIEWAKAYYLNDNSIVSDEEFDGAYLKFTELIKENPELEPEDSILKFVGRNADNRFKKVEHKTKMLSLSNAFNEDDLISFDKKIKTLLHVDKSFEYILEYKIDGLSISLSYEGGKLIQALTRGDGEVGEDVTHNVLTINDVPKTIEYKGSLEVRGEVYMSDAVFEELNANGDNFSNSRNAASGSIRQLDSSVAEKRKLSCFIYESPDKKNLGMQTHSELLEFIKGQGFSIDSNSSNCKDIKDVIATISKFESNRNDLGYAVDGIVVKLNMISLYDDIGYTVKFPKYMIAYKFPAEVASTTLEDIFVTIGRTGRVTYNAKLSPVRLAGSVISAATLHNSDYVNELGINVGDSVNIKKAGDIIPKVISVNQKINNEEWHEAKTCQGCDVDFTRKENEVDQYCLNKECPLVKKAMIEHFVSKKAMDIEGVSEKILETLISNDIMQGIPSLYKLHEKREEMLALPGFKEKSVNNILNAIESSKTQRLDKFIFGLGIRHLGEKGSKVLAKRFSSLNALMNASVENLLSVRDIGEKAAHSVREYFGNENNREMINELNSNGLSLKEFDKAKSDSFKNMTFVVTGTLSKPRKHFEEIIESHQGNLSLSVSKNTDYLLIGENAGSKFAKAKQLSVKIVNETEFEALIGGTDERN